MSFASDYTATVVELNRSLDQRSLGQRLRLRGERLLDMARYGAQRANSATESCIRRAPAIALAAAALAGGVLGALAKRR